MIRIDFRILSAPHVCLFVFVSLPGERETVTDVPKKLSLKMNANLVVGKVARNVNIFECYFGRFSHLEMKLDEKSI